MAKITVMGMHSTGKRTIVSAFAGIERDKIVGKW
jgi:hypothetical protein